MRNLNSTGGVVDEVELVIGELGKLHAAWWGDARLDQTQWLPMKGILTPDQAPVVLIQNWRATCLKSPSLCTRDLRER